MKSKNFYLFLLMVLTANFIFAQPPRDAVDRMQNMVNRKWLFLVQKAKLSNEEIDKTKPVFMDYESKVWAEHLKNHDFFKKLRMLAVPSKDECEKMNDYYAEMELRQAKLFKDYHSKLKKILSPETLFLYYQGDREFKQRLLSDFNRPKGYGKKW